MAPITNTVSTFVQSQVPEFIRSDPNSNFVAFLQAYYEWMEQANSGSDIINQSKQLPTYFDVDKTSDQFIQYFINDFLPNFPNDPALDERKLIKLSRAFYQKKGSANSIQFLFRALFNKEADIYFPKNQVLRASDGKWYQPKLLRIAIDPVLTANGFNYQQLVGRQGLGSLSNASCVIESATVAVDPGIGQAVLELYISNVNQDFLPQENLNIIFGYDSNNNALQFSERIINVLTGVVVAAPGGGGLKYRGKTAVYTGDPITFIGGLQAGDANAQPAVGYVNSVSQGAITGVVVQDGSFYYRPGGNTIITVTNAPGDTTGGNANVDVTAIDTGNLKTLTIGFDSIWYKQNVVLNTANFGFGNFATTNINTALNLAFTFASIQFGNIVSIGVISGGNNYQSPPTFSEQVIYYDDYANDLANNSSPLLATSVQPIDDLGLIAGVRILNGGTGYSNVTDQIVVPSSIGFNAAFTFSTGAGGVINSVSVTNPGNGYFYFPSQLALTNSTNTMVASNGTGAVLVGYLYGQGANLTSTVDAIGIIEDFYLASRGFDYVKAPRVSVRVEDLTLIDPGSNLVFVQDSLIFQGTNVNVSTFIANVASYNAASHILRLYDYQGNLNTSQNLITAIGNTNVAVNTAVATPVLVYGDGTANANAIFVAGEQNQPGFYINTDGQPSADRYLQDANTYHNYSYKIIVEQALLDYKSTLMHLVHPTGMSMLGSYSLVASNTADCNMVAYVGTWPSVSGTVSSNALLGWSANSLVVSSNNYNDGTYWGLGSFLASNVASPLAPDNLSLVKRCAENNTSAIHVLQHNGYTVVANQIYTLACYAHPNTGANQIYLCLDNNIANGFFGNFDLVSGNANSGVRTGSAKVISTSATPAGNGWFLCTVTGIISNSDTNGRISVGFNSNGTNGVFQSYAGSNANSMFLWGISLVPGNNQPFFTNSYGIVAGTGTAFSSNANLGDMIAFPAGSTTQKLQVKTITAFLNTGNLLIESNTSFPWYNVSVTSASNLIVSTANVQGNIAVNDLLMINVAGNAQSAIVQNIINANALNVNTVFNSTNANINMLVFPSLNGAAYLILNQSN